VSLLGIDVGTTACKAAAFRPDGSLLSLAYEEYDVKSPSPGRAELDPEEVWAKVVKVIGVLPLSVSVVQNSPASAA